MGGGRWEEEEAPGGGGDGGRGGWPVARGGQAVAPGTGVGRLTGWANELSEQDPRRQDVRGVLAKPSDHDLLRGLLSEPVLAARPPSVNTIAFH